MSKLTNADAEQMETKRWVSEALDCGYISTLDGVLHEDASEYFASDY
jgi:hypothetical protein